MSNFQTYELLPKEIYTIYGEAGLRWLDPKIIGVLEFVRSTFGKPVIVNDWYMGGQFNERSIRIPGHTHYDWRKPGHPSGRAVDFDVQGVPSFEVQQYLLKTHRPPLS